VGAVSPYGRESLFRLLWKRIANIALRKLGQDALQRRVSCPRWMTGLSATTTKIDRLTISSLFVLEAPIRHTGEPTRHVSGCRDTTPPRRPTHLKRLVGVLVWKASTLEDAIGQIIYMPPSGASLLSRLHDPTRVRWAARSDVSFLKRSDLDQMWIGPFMKRRHAACLVTPIPCRAFGGVIRINPL